MPDIIPFQPLRQTSRVLVAAPDGRTRDKLVADATLAGCDVQVANDLNAASAHLSQIGSDVCLIDLDETVGDIDAFCESSTSWRDPVNLLALASGRQLAAADVDLAGHFELLPKPCSSKRLAGRLAEAARRMKLREDNARWKRRARQRLCEEFVGDSPAAESVRSGILAAAELDSPLAIVGGRGSGTSHVARAVHLLGDRSHGPLIAVDCGLKTMAAMESDLFGTAPLDMAGDANRVQQAAGGTLVLEHIETAPVSLQKKVADLIRRQEEADHNRVRVIVITHAAPADLVEQGQFDAGLWGLLDEQVIDVPPLSRRHEDVIALAEHFLHRLSVEEGRPSRRLSYDARQLLTTYEWPGNACQLWNVVGRAVGIDITGTLTADDLGCWLDDEAASAAGVARGMTLREVERKLIETTFNRCGGNREQTAQALNIGLRTLSGKLRDYGYPPRGGPGSNLKIAQRKAA